MNKDVFYFDDYKSYLNTLIKSKPGRGRGMKSTISEALGCQTSYISQVLNDNAHFSLEHGDKLNAFLGHNIDESIFFLLLIQLARAGTLSLKKHWEREINLILKKRLVLRERLDVKKTLSAEDQGTYYSSWLYSVIHIMLTIPKFQDKESIAQHLNISISKVSEILDFLISIGLAKSNNNKFECGDSQIFLGSDSPLISKHHTNWRLQAIRATERENGENLHYSSTWSVSEKDFVKIKGQLVRYLDEVRDSLKSTSKEEEIICFNLDFFKV